MTEAELKAIMRGIGPTIRDYVTAAIDERARAGKMVLPGDVDQRLRFVERALQDHLRWRKSYRAAMGCDRGDLISHGALWIATVGCTKAPEPGEATDAGGVWSRVTTADGAADVEVRLRALEERPGLSDGGPWKSGQHFPAGAIVSYDGSGWICTATHASGTAFDHARFRLLVKRGRDAK